MKRKILWMGFAVVLSGLVLLVWSHSVGAQGGGAPQFGRLGLAWFRAFPAPWICHPGKTQNGLAGTYFIGGAK